MKKIIYIIDDNDLIRSIIKFSIFRAFDVMIKDFSKAEDALILINTEVPDLIILDYFLENSTGADFLAELSCKNKNIPVIMLSGQQDIKVAIELINHGAFEYINKQDLDYLDQLNDSISILFEMQKNYSEIETLKISKNNSLKKFAKFIILFFIVMAIIHIF